MFSIEKLGRTHSIEGFDCGREVLNRFLTRYAILNQLAGASQTWVALSGEALSGEEVIGYYTLVVGEVAYDGAAQRLKKGLARHPVPVMLLARLAVSLTWQGRGLGSGLLKDAMLRTLQAADIAGIRAFTVHAKDKEARAFYEHFGFRQSASDPMHLFRLLKDIRAEYPTVRTQAG